MFLILASHLSWGLVTHQAKGQSDCLLLCGMMLERKREFLRKGDKMTFHNIRFSVDSIDGRKADKIRVEQTQPRQ